MTGTSPSTLTSIVERILTAPTPDDLWELQAGLLAAGGDLAEKAREVAGQFHGFLRDLESKVASRGASRMAAVLETAAVSSVGLQEMLAEGEDPMRRLLASGVTAMLEVAAATKTLRRGRGRRRWSITTWPGTSTASSGRYRRPHGRR